LNPAQFNLAGWFHHVPAFSMKNAQGQGEFDGGQEIVKKTVGRLGFRIGVAPARAFLRLRREKGGKGKGGGKKSEGEAALTTSGASEKDKEKAKKERSPSESWTQILRVFGKIVNLPEGEGKGLGEKLWVE